MSFSLTLTWSLAAQSWKSQVYPGHTRPGFDMEKLFFGSEHQNLADIREVICSTSDTSWRYFLAHFCSNQIHQSEVSGETKELRLDLWLIRQPVLSSVFDDRRLDLPADFEHYSSLAIYEISSWSPLFALDSSGKEISPGTLRTRAWAVKLL